MATFLFGNIIFGPVTSRRMGVSLGVNLLPVTAKYCNFDCIYCECGEIKQPMKQTVQLLPKRADVASALQQMLTTMNPLPDAITFAGNGEPTIYPEFASVIDDVIELRNTYAKSAEVVVLTNASQMHKAHIMSALSKVDRCMFKLDSAIFETRQIINRPAQPTTTEKFIEYVTTFKGKIILQTMFVRGSHNGVVFDNTTEQEVAALIAAYKQIQPDEVIIYSIQRDTPIETITQVGKSELEKIALQIQAAGISVSVS